MNELTFSALWTAGLTTMIAAAGLLGLRIGLRGDPARASAAATIACVAILSTTLLLPFRIPAWLGPPAAAMRAPQRADAAASNATAATQNSRNVAESPQIDLLAHLARLRTWSSGQAATTARVGVLATAAMATAALFGLARFAVGLWLVGGLRRRSFAIDFPPAQSLLETLSHSLGLRRRVELRESAEVEGAAVSGLLRPVILLSPEWRSWPSDELRAVLAHELGHVLRGDVWRRLLTRLAQALHFYNPLVHWLAARDVLAQELAVDKLALAAVGGRERYLKSLSGLLLRLDARASVRSCGGIMPVFSGDGIRRITMLQSMDGTRPRPDIGAITWLTAAATVWLAVFGTALRGYAQPTVTTASSLPVAQAEESRLFQRPPLPAQQPVFTSDQGGLHVDFAAIRRSQAFGDLWMDAIESTLDEFLAQVFRKGASRSLDLTAVDVLTLAVVTSVRHDPEAVGEKNRLLVGSNKFLLETNRDVAWVDELRRLLPQFKQQPGSATLAGIIPELGPMECVLQPLSPRRLSFGLTAPLDAAPALPDWASEWDRCAGGVVTLLVPLHAASDLPLLADDPLGREVAALHNATALASIGIDIDQDEPVIEFRMRLMCRTEADLPVIRRSVREILAVSIRELEHPPTINANTSPAAGLLLQALKSHRVVETPDSPGVIELRFRSEIPRERIEQAREFVRQDRKNQPPVRQADRNRETPM